MTEVYQTSYTTFGGCDMVISMDSKVIGEIQGISYTEELTEDEYKVKGICRIITFERDPLEEFFKEDYPFNISIKLANEFGKRAHTSITDCKMVKRHGGGSIDDVVLGMIYEFKGKSLVSTFS